MLNAMIDRIGWWFHRSRRDGDRYWRIWFHRKEEVAERFRQQGIKNYLRQIAIEFSLFPKRVSLTAEFKMKHDCEGTLGVHFAFPWLFSLWINFDIGYTDWAKRICGEYTSRRWGFDIYADAFVLNWWADSNAWGPDRKRYGFHFYFPWDKFKGKVTYTKTDLETHVVTFEQPAYKSRPATTHSVTVTRKHMTWKYGNPFVKTIDRTFWNFDFKRELDQKPPAFSGKGENSWDCGDDGIYGCSFDVSVSGQETIEGAINAYIAKVIENRKRYG